MRRIVLGLSAALLTTACSQHATQVSQKGHMFYGYQQASYTTPQAGQYRPSPYSPDYRVGNGRVELFDRVAYGQQERIPPEATYAAPQTEIVPYSAIQSKDLSAPAANSWQAAPTTQRAMPMRTANNGFMPPVEANVINGYGKGADGQANDGINYLIPAGEPVYASAGGQVAYVGDELKSYGQMVIVKHADGYNTTYAHLGRTAVSKHGEVQQGQIIGYVGQTGNVSQPQLHFAIRKGTDPVDPNSMLSKQVALY